VTDTRRTIKVQFLGTATEDSIAEFGIEATIHPLTFHAYSDEMKARVFENMVALGTEEIEIAVSFTDAAPRTGEWHEPLVYDSLVLVPKVAIDRWVPSD
jgi:hypothetical protein